jgi:hypothetical protein
MTPKDTDTLVQSLDAWASAGQSIVAAVALVVGGLFAYFKFFKGRVYRPRVDMTIEPVVLATGVGQTLVCHLKVKNIGTSKVTVEHEGTSLKITPGDLNVQAYEEPSWRERELLAYEVFPTHSWVESGETIFHDVAVALPQPRDDALKIELRLVMRRRLKKNLEANGLIILPTELPT